MVLGSRDSGCNSCIVLLVLCKIERRDYGFIELVIRWWNHSYLNYVVAGSATVYLIKIRKEIRSWRLTYRLG